MSALQQFREQLSTDPQLRKLVANLPEGARALAAVEREDAAALQQVVRDVKIDDFTTTLRDFSREVTRARAARAAEAKRLAVENFQQTFATAAPDAIWFRNVRATIAADAELRAAFRLLPEGEEFLAALDAADVTALQTTINRRLEKKPLATDAHYGPVTHDTLLAYLGVARMFLQHAPDGPKTLRQELELDFDRQLGLGGARRVPTDERLRKYFDALRAEMPAELKSFIAGLVEGKRVLDALERCDAKELNRVFGTADPDKLDARYGYDFLTHSALGLYLDNAKHRFVQVELWKRAQGQTRAAIAKDRKRRFEETDRATWLRQLGESLRARNDLQLKMDLRFRNAGKLGEALKNNKWDEVRAFARENGYQAPDDDFGAFVVIEQLVDDMKACKAPPPPPPRDEAARLLEGELNATIAGETFFVSYSAALDEKRALALKAGVGPHGLDSAELWFNQQEENKRYTAALRADFLERTFAAKFESEGRRDIGRGFSHEWKYQVGFSVLKDMYSTALVRRGRITDTDKDGNPIFGDAADRPDFSYDTVLLVAAARYGIGFDRTWIISDQPGKKLSIGFNWHGDIGLHLAYELYHPPGNERALAASQSNITFTDISYLLGMGELHARTTANFTVEGELRGVSFRGLAHLDSKIGIDDPTLGFTHNHNVAAALDLGFLNDSIALHLGANVPIHPSTLDATITGTVGITLKPTDEFSLGGSASFDLTDGRLLGAGGEITWTPDRLFGLDTNGALFVRGSYEFSPSTGGHSFMTTIGINFGAPPARPSTVNGAYENPALPSGGVGERAPRPTTAETTYKSVRCLPALIADVRDTIQSFRSQAKAAGSDEAATKKMREAMKLLKTPEMASAACSKLGALFEYRNHLDEPSKFSPVEFFVKGYGVCAEFHIFAAATLREDGRRAYPLEYFAPARSHVVCVFLDDEGKWQILEYGQIHLTDAASVEEAIKSFEPGVMKYKVFEPEGGRARVVHQGETGMTASLRDFFERSWI